MTKEAKKDFKEAAPKEPLPKLTEVIDHPQATLDHIRYLIKAGVDPNETDARGRTPIRAIMERGWYEAGELLLKAGAKPPAYKGDPNGHIDTDTLNTIVINYIQEAEQYPALTYYIKQAYPYEYIFTVLANGADVNKVSKTNESPLEMATSRDHHWPYVALELVKRGAWLDPAKPDPDEVIDPTTGATRLLAVLLEGKDHEALKRVLDSGADPNKADRYGLTPLAVALALKWPYAEKILLERGAKEDVTLPDPDVKVGRDGRDENTPLLQYAMKYYHPNFTLALLEAGANPNAVDASGKSALHWAAINGNDGFFLELEKAGADIHLKATQDGLRPLDYACMNNQYDIAAYILGKCTPEQVNEKISDQQLTALHLAMRRKGAADLVQLLVDHGADINATSKDGYTPLMTAGKHGWCNDREMMAVLQANDKSLPPPPSAAKPARKR